MTVRYRSSGRLLLLGICGVAAGVINGLLGAGSGVLIAYALGAISPQMRADSRTLFANATAIILPISLVSTVSYAIRGTLPLTAELGRYLLPGLLGGFAGAWLLGRLPEAVIRRIFGGVVLISGLIMLFR